MIKKLILLILLIVSNFVQGQTVSNLAGDGTAGFNNGEGAAAIFDSPSGVTIDAGGSVYVVDQGNNRIRKVTKSGEVSTFAGSGILGDGDGNAATAQFRYPRGITKDGVGNFYVTEFSKIKKITSAGVVSTFVGGSSAGFSDGTGSAALFQGLMGIVCDAFGNIYVADSGNNRIRKITSDGIVSTFAGSGVEGFADGASTTAQFNAPTGVAIDPDGNLYVTDSQGYRIRKITPTGLVSTLAGGTSGSADGAGSTAQFYSPFSITIDSFGKLYVADINRIREISTDGVVTTLAGSGIFGSVDGPAATSRFGTVLGICVDASGNIFMSDNDNNKIKKIDFIPVVETIAFSVGDIGAVKAVLKGNVISDGGKPITDRGIVWGTTPNPDISNNKFQMGSGVGSFSGSVSSFPTGTVIYYRAYAVNSTATSYGSELTFKTEDALSGEIYVNVITACSGDNGSISASVSGGVLPYSYSWSPSGGTAHVTPDFTQGSYSGLTMDSYTVTITDGEGTQIALGGAVNEVIANTITIGGSVENVSCFEGSNGSVKANVTGGSGSYTYLWSPSGGTAATASGLKAGRYTVTVTDSNGCKFAESFDVGEPAKITALVSKMKEPCYGESNGSATLSVTGGSGSYTYSWSPSGGTAATATGLSAGTYAVKITDANLCSITENVTIKEQPKLIVSSISQTDVFCFGEPSGSAEVSVTGGSGSYTYLWSPSGGTAAKATGLSAGTYAVKITDDNLCSIVENVTIKEQPKLIVSSASQTDVSCFGESNGSATVNVTGGSGSYTYLWSPSGGTAATVTGLKPGAYTVTATDSKGCAIQQSFFIAQPSELKATVDKTDVSCFGGSNGTAKVTPTDGSGRYKYSWFPSGGSGALATGLSAGDYTVTVTDANLCSVTHTITIKEPSALMAWAGAQTNVSCHGGSNGSATVKALGASGSYTYLWSPSGGTAATAKGLVAGDYKVTVTDSGPCGTITTQNFKIIEPALLEVSASITNVSCFGGSNGSAVVSVTGGTGSYTYSWSPSGGAASAAYGLSAGNYSVTITDDNGCFVIKSINIETSKDVSAPVPNLTNLPDIINYCAVLSSDISVPTATDNCKGTIIGTTTAALNYTTPGTYVITWSYNDGNGNTSTQNQTVRVLSSPLDQVTLKDTEFTYNGNLHSIQVGNLPAGATVSYAVRSEQGTVSIPVNVGIYNIKATVTPSANTPNCLPVVLTAKLTIKKAVQVITFNPIPSKTLGDTNAFNLTASSSSGLPVVYTFKYTTDSPAANVSNTGEVNLLRSGQIVITASQAGNSNYLPAADVPQVLRVKNNISTVSKMSIGSEMYTNPSTNITYLMECGESDVSVSIFNDLNASINTTENFTISTPKPGIYEKNVTITSEDESSVSTYKIKVEKPFSFFDLVHVKHDNTLIVNNNPLTNGGYEFVAYQWFKNGQLIGAGQYYSAGNNVDDTLDATADYMVKVTGKDGIVLQSCISKITLQKSLQAKIYPNPVQTGKIITVEADFPEEELKNMNISLYTVTGQLLKKVQSSMVKTDIQLPSEAQSDIYVIVIETSNLKKTLKLIVK